MKKIKISKSLVFYNSHKYNAGGKLKDFIDGTEIEKLIKKVEENIESEFILVLGGDGTILKTIRQAYEKQLPVLGINFGTKGFLLTKIEEIIECTNFETIKYPLIECTISTKKEIISRIAFNEVDIRADTGKVLDLDVFLEKKGENKLKVNLKGDGLIISTPAGTTGYNYSLGGPIIPHLLKSFVLTPKAALSPRNFRSIVLEEDREVIVRNVGRLSDLKVICDGSDFFFTKDEEIEISIKKSNFSIKLLFPENSKNTLKDKIFLEQGFDIV
ncbi:MAG: NAD(+)/NADH kinase [Candidatus Gracilibacteria bacterium]|nr:NAD(+)/NADH kinase [Candidatus Gracilibacteria bacterium]